MAEWLEATISGRKDWNATHFSLEIEAELDAFEAGQFVRVALDIDGERVARPYSLVNSPGTAPLEIFLNKVPEGPLSSALAGLAPGDPIALGPSANGFLTLNEVPEHVTDLWLMGTGTGVGPFLSMLGTDTAWERFDTIKLVYGTRWRSNLAYQELIRAVQERHPGQFHYVPMITGEAHADGLGCRITDGLGDGSLEAHVGQQMSPDRSHVMLCGRQDMISEVMTLLEPRGFRRHRRREPGQISTEKYH